MTAVNGGTLDAGSPGVLTWVMSGEVVIMIYCIQDLSEKTPDMTDQFPATDDLGPFKILHVHEPALDLRGIVVIDNVAAGPAIGGLRMAPDVSLEECRRLARAMTLKNAAAELPHGGGKSVLIGDPRMPVRQKQLLIRAFARALHDTREYIVGPDMGTNEVCMAWIRDEIGRSVGLPRVLGGIPLDEIGATGWGVAHSAGVAAEFAGVDLEGARVAVQGFGAVGQHGARFLQQMGAILVAASDSRGTVMEAGGLDVDALAARKAAGGSVLDHDDGEKADCDAIVDVDCDIWVPAARPDVLTKVNVSRLKAKMVIQGANIPATPEAERYLADNGVVNVPDFIANAGGVICAAMEYAGASEGMVFRVIEDKIRRNTRLVLEASAVDSKTPREAAVALADERVREAMSYRRWSSGDRGPGH